MSLYSLQDYIDQDLCLAYGAVIYGDPNHNWESYYNSQKGFYELRKIDPGKDDDPSLLQSFLSAGMDYRDYSRWVFGKEPTTSLGEVKQTYLTQSTDPKRNFEASSGGTIREVLRYLYHSKKIDSFIGLKEEGTCQYVPWAYYDESDIDTIPPSVYHAIDTSRTIKILIDAPLNARVAVIGAPWQLDDMYLFIRNHRPDLRDKIVLTIGLLTGWYFSMHSVHALCENHGIDGRQLEKVTYRGQGKKGRLRFFDANEKCIREVDRFSPRSKACTEISYNLPMFLLYPNTHNMLADLVVGDPHLPECGFSKPGMSLTISRSAFADSVIRDMSERGFIRSKVIDDSALIRSQKRERLYGDLAFPYAGYMRSIGKPAPLFHTPGQEDICPIKLRRVRRIHRMIEKKVALQRKGKYRHLYYLYRLDQMRTNLLQAFSLRKNVRKISVFIRKRAGRPEFLQDFN